MIAEVLLILRRHHSPLGGLLHRQAHPTPLHVDVDDLHPHLLAGGDHLLKHLHVVRYLGNVDEPFDVLPDLHERPERHEFRDAPVDQLPDSVRGNELFPGIRLGALDGETDAFPLDVNLQHFHPHLVARRKQRTGVVKMPPGKFGHVHEPVHSADVHERSERNHRRHDTISHLARLELIEKHSPLLLLLVLQPSSTRENNVVPVLV